MGRLDIRSFKVHKVRLLRDLSFLFYFILFFVVYSMSTPVCGLRWIELNQRALPFFERSENTFYVETLSLLFWRWRFPRLVIQGAHSFFTAKFNSVCFISHVQL